MHHHFIQLTLACCLMAAACLSGCSKDSETDDPSDTGNKDESKDPIHEFFADEVGAVPSITCYNGAYYRKIISSNDYWLGIEGRVKLPTIVFDPNRINPDKPQRYLDNPSVYMGGTANKQETDIGLTWEVIRDESGAVTPDCRAFRPFMRRTAYTLTRQPADYSNAPAQKEYYWYPGEEITMSVQVIRDGILKFTVEGAGKKYETEYPCDGYRLNNRMQFKRVNAIDQVSNEGKPVQVTQTRVENAIWYETNLYRNYQSQIVKAPMHTARYTDMRCPDTRYFVIDSNETAQKIGGEEITIDGGK